MFTYEIEDKKYYQKKLVLGQISQISALFKDIRIPPLFSLSDNGEGSDLNLNYEAIGALLGDNLPRAIAIVLVEDGVPLQNKDMDRLTADVTYSFDAETVMQVVEDFLDCNPINLLLERWIGMMKSLKTSMEKKTGSPGSASSSPEEISQNMMVSSGDIPSNNVSHI